MLIVIKLQGLHAEAGCEDIRRFFHRLLVPEGAVHIVGGDLAEAFILFTSERDAQLSLRQSGETLKGSKVIVSISSAAELRQKVSLALSQEKKPCDNSSESLPLPVAPLQENSENNDQSEPSQDAATLLLTLLIALKKMDSDKQSETTADDPRTNQPSELTAKKSASAHSPASVGIERAQHIEVKPLSKEVVRDHPGYLRIYGLPPSVTKADISHFLHGICVLEAHFNICVGGRHGCLVKVAREEEAEVGLQCDGRTLGGSLIEVRRATEKQWRFAIAKPQQVQTITSTSETTLQPQKKCSSIRKRPYSEGLPLKENKNKCKEYYIMVQNLEPTMNKTDIKALLQCPHLPKDSIQHLLDKNGNRSSTAFVAFDRTDDYISAINLSGSPIGNLVLNVSPVTREKMMSELLAHRKNVSTPAAKLPKQPPSSGKNCLYIRNLPEDVSPRQVQAFFKKFRAKEEDIALLKDGNGNCLGEAVVSFHSEDTAFQAYTLNNSLFKGKSILLSLITSEQFKVLSC